MTPAQQALVKLQSNTYITLYDMLPAVLPLIQSDQFKVEVVGDGVIEALDDDMISSLSLYAIKNTVYGMYLSEDYLLSDRHIADKIPAKCVRVYQLAHQQE